MPVRAHVYRSTVSIARILLPAICLLPLSTVFSAELEANADDSPDLLTNSLPKIENTNHMDRFLSREVKDSYIFGPLSSTKANHKNDQLLNEPAAAGDLTASDPTASDPTASDPAAGGPAAGDPEATLVIVPKPNAVAATDNSAPAQDVLPNAGLGQDEPLVSPAAQIDPWQSVNNDDPTAIKSVWEHIIRAERLPLAEHERVKFYEDQYRRESMWISKILDRGSPFLAHLVSSLDERFMPIELALLPAIESGYLTTAKSAGNAAGLWQIVPITAKEIGVTRNAWFDGRGDILKSTTAAIDYLSYLNSTFDGDWELTLAAYNAGPGRVKQAIRKNAAAGLPTDYWSLNLPSETMNYVPKLVALVRLIKQVDHGGLTVPHIKMVPAFESIDVGFRVSLDKVAKMTNIDEADLRSLNAGLIYGVTAPDGPHHLLIPAGTGQRFQQAFANVDPNSAFSEPRVHEVVSGDSVSSIALKYGLTQRALIAMNGLDDAKIKIGQKLAVLDSRHISDSVVEYVVTIGDTLSEIADKFSVNVNDIKLSTGEAIKGDIIHPGTTLNITVDLPSSG